MENLTEFNSSITESYGHNQGPSVVTEDVYNMYLKVTLPISAIIAMSGIACNLVNVRTFYLLGLNDGISVNFFALSLTDLFYVAGYLWLTLSYLVVILEQEDVIWFTVSPYIFVVFSGNSIVVVSAINMFTVNFLAVARCLCVAMPLHFKNMFTKSRSLAFFVSFVVICVVIFVPVFAHMGVQRLFDTTRNVTRVFLWFSPHRERIKDAILQLLLVAMPLIVEVTLIVCVAVITRSLRKSATFRRSQKNPTTEQQDSTNTEKVKLSLRERKVVIQVLLISVIYLIVNSIKIFISIWTQIDPDFAINRRYHYLYFLLNDISVLCDCINSTANFFVYYTFNSAFREVCLSFFQSPSLKLKK